MSKLQILKEVIRFVKNNALYFLVFGDAGAILLLYLLIKHLRQSRESDNTSN